MPRIDVNEKYCVISDADQWTVYEKGTNKNEDGKNYGKETLKALAFVSELSHCYRYLLRRKVRLIEGNDFKAIMSDVARIEAELKESIRI